MTIDSPIATVAATIPQQRTRPGLPPTGSTAPDSQPHSPAGRWQASYQRRVRVTDLVVIGSAVLLSQLVTAETRSAVGIVEASLVSVGLIGLWFAAVGINGARDRKVLGAGAGEYRRIIQASLYLFGAIAIVGFLADLEHVRRYLAIALPLGLVGLMGTRWVWRLLLREYRRFGSHLHRVVLAGGGPGVREMADRFGSRQYLGFELAGVCVPAGDGADFDGLPTSHDPDDLAAFARQVGADLVAVTAHDFVGPARIRSLGWSLEGSGVQLALAPSLTDVAGPRIHVKPVAGLAMMLVEEPRFRGPKLVAKVMMDWFLALVALVLLSPVLLVTAVLVKRGDGGPVFFRHERVGLGGSTFRVWKFRTMTIDADAAKDSVRAATAQTASVFFKSAEDPRITRIGRLLRRTSIDELPQLFNVLAGQMSLVGPRPLVPGEGSEVGNFLERRMLVRPGITGLWQVSGRSDVSDTERIRMDFYYVENWSLAGDLVILLRTAASVLRREGAY